MEMEKYPDTESGKDSNQVFFFLHHIFKEDL